jgi:hypothetical protein
MLGIAGAFWCRAVAVLAAGLPRLVCLPPITESMLSPQPSTLPAEVVVTADPFPIVIHRSDQLSTGQGVGLTKTADQSPPYAEFFCTVVYIPAQNIFPKVKAANIASDLHFYYCDVVHILKTRNALNFLPYI